MRWTLPADRTVVGDPDWEAGVVDGRSFGFEEKRRSSRL